MEENIKNENQDKTGENKPLRDEKGRLLPGYTANPEGRPEDTPEQKAVKKAIKQLVEEYTGKLAEALPKISPILIDKAIIDKDIQAIKEINDRVMGKPKQPITGGDEEDKPISILTNVPNNQCPNPNPETDQED